MQSFTMLKRNLVYTAITRGRNLVIIVGQKKALAIAVRDNKGLMRYTIQVAGVSFFLYFRFKLVAKYMYKLLQSDKTHFTF